METHPESLDSENTFLMTELKTNKFLLMYAPSKLTMTIWKPGPSVDLFSQTIRKQKEYFTTRSSYALAAKTT